MQPLALNHIRIARPSAQFAQTEDFWVSGIGLTVLGRTDNTATGDHALVFLGWPDAAWHLELVDSPELPPQATVEDLLVLYIAEPVEQGTVDRILSSGGKRVHSHNPYWDENGVTFEDPDGYRCVLSSQFWS